MPGLGRHFFVRSASRVSGRAVILSAGPAAISSRPRKLVYLQLVVVVDDERRVVGEPPGFVDLHRVRTCSDAGSRDLIVDPPADILRPGLAAIRPPRVLLGPRVDAPEHI